MKGRAQIARLIRRAVSLKARRNLGLLVYVHGVYRRHDVGIGE